MYTYYINFKKGRLVNILGTGKMVIYVVRLVIYSMTMNKYNYKCSTKSSLKKIK